MTIKNKITLLLTGVAILAGSQPAMSLSTSYYSRASVLSEGRWLKVKISDEGIYELSFDELKKWGLNPARATVWGFDATRLAEHRFSTTIPDDLPQIPTMRADDRIYFYARGNEWINVDGLTVAARRNLTDNYGYYFVTDSREPSVVLPTGSAEIDHTMATLTNHVSFVYNKPEEFNPSGKGPLFFGNPMSPGQSRTFTFDLTDITGAACLNYRYIGRVTSGNTIKLTASDGISMIDAPRAKITNNNMTDPHHIYNFSSPDVINFTVDTEVADVKNANFTFTVPSSSSIEYMSMDYVGVAYNRKNRLLPTASQMRMDFQNTNYPVLANVSGCTPSTVVWDITTPECPGIITTEFDTNGVIKFNAKANQSVILFDTSRDIPAATIVGHVDNQNLHALATPDMLIISGTGFEPYAERIAELHRTYQGMDVAVATHDDIINEFASGSNSVDAYRRLAKMMRDRNPSKLKYILFVGSGWYDYRGLGSTVQPGRLMVYAAEREYAVNNNSRNYCNDNFFGMLEDSFAASSDHRTVPGVAVGRINGTRAADFETYLAKAEDHLKSISDNKALPEAIVLTCDGDMNTHLFQGENMAKAISAVNSDITIDKLYSALYYYDSNNRYAQQTDRLKSLLGQGVDFLYYTGHAGPGEFLGVDVNTAGTIDFGTRPLTFLATCETWPFDIMTDRSITDALLFAEKGPVNIVASGRTVYQTHNGTLGDKFASILFNNNDDCRYVGDVWRKAIAETTGTGTTLLCYNNMCYNLAGDPAMPIKRPTLKATLTAIDGKAATGDAVTSCFPLKPFTLSGTVNTDDGTVDTSFNGTVTVTVFETPSIKESYLTNENDDRVKSELIERDETVLARAKATVTNGKWSVTITCPEPVQTTDGLTNRVAIFALADDKVNSAAGTDRGHLAINALRDATTETDRNAPVINRAFINSADFIDGATVGPDNRLVARITPSPSGFNMSSTAIGGVVKLVLDDKLTFSDATSHLRPNTDGTFTLDYQLPSLSDGSHHVTLTVTDNAGNSSDITVTFNVASTIKASLTAIGGDPAREDVEIRLNANVDNLTAGRLIIEDATGKTVFTTATTDFPFTWDLTGNDGKRVADGSYSIYAIINAAGVRFSTMPVKVTVIK